MTMTKEEREFSDKQKEKFLRSRRNHTITLIEDDRPQNVENCIICGYRTLPARNWHDICDVCFWEDIDDHEGDPNKPSMWNSGLTINEARRNYKIFKAVSADFLDYVREPREEEK